MYHGQGRAVTALSCPSMSEAFGSCTGNSHFSRMASSIAERLPGGVSKSWGAEVGGAESAGGAWPAGVAGVQVSKPVPLVSELRPIQVVLSLTFLFPALCFPA